MMSVLRVNVGPFSDNFLMLWLVPVQRSCVLSSFNLRQVADIQRLISAIYDSNVAEAVLLQWRYSCMSWVKAFRVTQCLAASSKRSAVYKIISWGPSTDHCGTEQVMVILVDVIPAYERFCQSGMIGTRIVPVLWYRNPALVSVVTVHDQLCRMQPWDPINTWLKFVHCQLPWVGRYRP